ncbi:MAG: PD-(D/E)XK nuclease family protein [Verrucomicrobiae bacterium]|nr:PD-(D/E)XK nuclease family protein [Verrucomicrobiae bacterium]
MKKQLDPVAEFDEWEKLLTDFDSLPDCNEIETELFSQVNQLLADFDGQQNSWREEQKVRADDFNILQTMRLSRRELCHSDILAWLLDRNGSHAQGDLGFCIFLKMTSLPIWYAANKYRVIRELSGNESQIDIVIEAEEVFIIGIENKIDSEEGDTQTDREWRDLQRRKNGLLIPNEAVAFFLTPDGTMPICKSFKPISWGLIAEVFEAFSEVAQADMVKMFAKHYAETVRREISRTTEQG